MSDERLNIPDKLSWNVQLRLSHNHPMSTLTEQTVVVVGASSGIGLAAARAASGGGARVVMLSRSSAKLEEASKTVPGITRPIVMDMLDPHAVERAFTSIGAIDHLVLTAVANEYQFFGPIMTLTSEQIERSLDKLRGFLNVVRAAAALIRPRGSICLVSGAGAVKPPRGTALPAIANAGVVSLGRALAVELSPVRVNTVMPGVVDTDIHGDKRQEIKEWAESVALPARRFGQPDDIADAILFLLANPYMTGHTLVVDGGYLLT
jgi:NAD(P)-dependent dehydrogenase (short-subunit alcohol dehydrogenase family)